MPRLLLTIVLMGYVSVAWAGPLEGELFGYKLGSQYHLTDRIQKRAYYAGGVVALVAEQPEKPEAFQRVEILATSKTFTIANIYGIAEFPDETSAKALASSYVDLLGTLYASTCTWKRDVSPLDLPANWLTFLCGGQYELTVWYFEPHKDKPETHTVHVGLTFDHSSETWKRLQTQFTQEWHEVETAERHERLEQAKKSQKLKGLQ